MATNLICVHPFGDFVKGQQIADPDQVAALTQDREHHFVRISVPDPVTPAPPVESSKSKS